jgi:hypothetical protein
MQELKFLQKTWDNNLSIQLKEERKQLEVMNDIERSKTSKKRIKKYNRQKEIKSLSLRRSVRTNPTSSR